MPKLHDITGKKYGRLTAVKCLVRSHIDSKGKLIPTKWLCICDCGTFASAKVESLKNGDKKSCGCLKRELHHGLTGHYLYSTWVGIKNRCSNPNTNNFKDYGARGIRMYPEWEGDFMAFYTYITETLGDRPTPKHSLDRINPEVDNYEPGKLRWATPTEQNNNASRNVILEFNGRTQNLSQWCAELNLKYQTVRDRIGKLKWDTVRALTTPAPPFDGSCDGKQISETA